MNLTEKNGADFNWYKKYHKKPSAIKKYHMFFRQKDTLKSIPPMLEEKVKLEDKEAYNNELALAKERRAKVKKDGDGVTTIPSEAAIVKDE